MLLCYFGNTLSKIFVLLSRKNVIIVLSSLTGMVTVEKCALTRVFINNSYLCYLFNRYYIYR